MSTLANLTAQLALMSGAADSLGQWMQKQGKQSNGGLDEVAENTAKMSATQEQQMAQQDTHQKSAIKSQNDANASMINGFSSIQTEVVEAITKMTDHFDADASSQKIQSNFAILQGVQQFAAFQKQEPLFKQMKHMAEQNYVAVNQVATEIVKMHGSMIGSTREQKLLEIRKMKDQRHGHLKREQQIGSSIDFAIKKTGLEGYAYNRSDLESLIATGSKGDKERASRALQIQQYADNMRHGQTYKEYNDTAPKPHQITKKDAKLTAKYVKHSTVGAGHSLRGDGTLQYDYVKGNNVSGFSQQRHDRNRNKAIKADDEFTKDNDGIPPNTRTLKDLLGNISMSAGSGQGNSRGWNFTERGEEGLASGRYKLFDHKGEGRDGKTPGLYDTETNKFVEQAQLQMSTGASSNCCDGIATLVESNANILRLMEKADSRAKQNRRDQLEKNRDNMFSGKKKGGIGGMFGKDGGDSGGFFSSLLGGIGNFGAGAASALGGVGAYSWSKAKLAAWSKANPPKGASKGIVKGALGATWTAASRVATPAAIAFGAANKMENEGQGGIEGALNTVHDTYKEIYSGLDWAADSLGMQGTPEYEKEQDKYFASRSDVMGNGAKHQRREDYQNGVLKYTSGIKDNTEAESIRNSLLNPEVTQTALGTYSKEDSEKLKRSKGVIKEAGTRARLGNRVTLADYTHKELEALFSTLTFNDDDESELLTFIKAKQNKQKITVTPGVFGPTIEFGKPGSSKKVTPSNTWSDDDKENLVDSVSDYNELKSELDLFKKNNETTKEFQEWQNDDFASSRTRPARYADAGLNKQHELLSSDTRTAKNEIDRQMKRFQDKKFGWKDTKTWHGKSARDLQRGKWWMKKNNTDSMTTNGTTQLQMDNALFNEATGGNAGQLHSNDKLISTQKGIEALGGANVAPLSGNKFLQKPTVVVPKVDHSKNYQQGFDGIDQFMHGVVNKETSSGFMGFNPIRSMAHGQVGDIMGQFKNPDNVTPEMVSSTRAMIADKAGSMLGPQKTEYILERFDQFVKTLGDYKDSKVINANDKVEKSFYEKALHPGSIYTNDIHTTERLDKIIGLMSNEVYDPTGKRKGWEDSNGNVTWGPRGSWNPKGKKKGKKKGNTGWKDTTKGWKPKDFIDDADKNGLQDPESMQMYIAANQMLGRGNASMSNTSWFNKGYIPGEEKWSLAKHRRNEVANLSYSNRAYANGGTGRVNIAGTAKAFWPGEAGTLNTGPTAGFRNISKFASRGLPLLGAAMSGYDATQRFAQGDNLGGALSVASAYPVAGLVPLAIQVLTDYVGITGNVSQSQSNDITNLTPMNQNMNGTAGTGTTIINNNSTSNSSSATAVVVPQTVHAPSSPSGNGSSLVFN